MKYFRWLICGGRDYNDFYTLCQRLDRFVKDNEFEPELVIQGGAKGADTLAMRWALNRGIDCLTVPAKWSVHGKSAGPIRNARMIEYNPDVIVAFPGGTGTEDMIDKAKHANIPVVNLR